ncbi:uncharacterized protein AB675_5080 [Cyphellophora attinorum]|uniref:Alpha-L-rhamnosidase six-hairpin glycosidase domain-containing protein n=1 Tax=Cyphellophora attinorum TaxID=1664694 RepID=A0A0N1P0R6_9EURO|nr:uncharacterized protein AB675_5080 [Phialophora attinorum]KPI39454.1 hypothetical protein AB675_5080 [Phialophora attinorum]
MASQKWYDEACWIWARDYHDTSAEGRIALFRRHFKIKDLPELPTIVRVSADTRYCLYVNGMRVSVGPCKSYPEHWYFEVVDIRPFLRSGENVLSAKVLRFSDKHPGSMSFMRTASPGLIVHGEVEGQKLHTGVGWLAQVDRSTTLENRKDWNYALGPPFLVLGETVDANELEEDWHMVSSSAWAPAVVVSPKSMMLPVLDAWNLHERPIPLLTETKTGLKRVIRCSDPAAFDGWSQFATEDRPLEVRPSSTIWVEYEAEEYTTAYIALKCHASAGATIRLLYSECYERPMSRPGPGAQRVKANRSDHVNKMLYGSHDTYITRNGLNTYTPFWFRAFRFLRLEITTPADSPALKLMSLDIRATYYPLRVHSTISTPENPTLAALWETSIATLRNCMHETYEDCPFYEQNQFLMDSRLQMLFTYVVSRDDRLARKTMHEFHASRLSTGLLRAHFPSPGRTVNIPMFSLFFVAMVHDHYTFFGDLALVRGYLATIDGVLEYYHGLVSERGLVGRFDEQDWAFVDWVKEWQRPGGLHGMGVPPSYSQQMDSVATVHSLVYAWALGLAAELCSLVGRADTAREYSQRKMSISDAVKTWCWSGDFFTDSCCHYSAVPEHESNTYSQHAQVWAILAGAVDGEQATDLLRRTMSAAKMPRCSYAMTFYVFRAAAMTGLYEELWPQLIAPWEKMLAQDLVTFAEDDVGVRSDCHGWSAVPLWEIGTEIFGIVPGVLSGKEVVKPRVKILGDGKSTGEFIGDGDGRKMRVKVDSGVVSVERVSGGASTRPVVGGWADIEAFQ